MPSFIPEGTPSLNVQRGGASESVPVQPCIIQPEGAQGRESLWPTQGHTAQSGDKVENQLSPVQGSMQPNKPPSNQAYKNTLPFKEKLTVTWTRQNSLRGGETKISKLEQKLNSGSLVLPSSEVFSSVSSLILIIKQFFFPRWCVYCVWLLEGLWWDRSSCNLFV